jgi:hypothetical protein
MDIFLAHTMGQFGRGNLLDCHLQDAWYGITLMLQRDAVSIIPIRLSVDTRPFLGPGGADAIWIGNEPISRDLDDLDVRAPYELRSQHLRKTFCLLFKEQMSTDSTSWPGPTGSSHR